MEIDGCCDKLVLFARTIFSNRKVNREIRGLTHDVTQKAVLGSRK